MRDRQHPHWSNICGSNGQRISTAFVSDTNEVEVRILAGRLGHREQNFVIHYRGLYVTHQIEVNTEYNTASNTASFHDL